MLASWRSMTKIAGSGSGSIRQRHGSMDRDTDPHRNVMDPEHCFQEYFSGREECVCNKGGRKSDWLIFRYRLWASQWVGPMDDAALMSKERKKIVWNCLGWLHHLESAQDAGRSPSGFPIHRQEVFTFFTAILFLWSFAKWLHPDPGPWIRKSKLWIRI